MILVIGKIQRKIKSLLRRKKAKRTAYIYPEQVDGWSKYGKPILGNRKEGTYFDPYVYKIGEIYIMYVSHRDDNTIVRLISEDGINWKDKEIVLKGIKESEWETAVNRACVVQRNDLFYMWYTGQNNGKSSIGLAISEDGKVFKRYLENPVLQPDKVYEEDAVMNPCVIWDEKKQIYKMWYSAGESYEPDIICYAESLDGIQWKKYEENPVLKKSFNNYDKAKVGGCDVIYIDDKYLIFYIGYENVDNARICWAESTDGISWIRKDNNPILAASKDKWDCDAVYKPAVSIEKDKWCLWYNGRCGTEEYIGLAVKEN